MATWWRSRTSACQRDDWLGMPTHSHLHRRSRRLRDDISISVLHVGEFPSAQGHAVSDHGGEQGVHHVSALERTPSAADLSRGARMFKQQHK